MTYEMDLLRERKKGKAEGRAEECENIAIKMLHRGKSFNEIQEFTELSLQRIRELAEKISVTDTTAKIT